MKRIIYLSAIALTVVLASCGKKYTCTCTNTSTGATTTSEVKGASKDAAQVTCVAKTNSSQGCAIL
jgi:hypothetical protein